MKSLRQTLSKLNSIAVCVLLTGLFFGNLSAQIPKTGSEPKLFSLAQLTPGTPDFRLTYPDYIPGLCWYGDMLIAFPGNALIAYKPNYREKGNPFTKDAVPALTLADLTATIPGEKWERFPYVAVRTRNSKPELIIPGKKAFYRFDLVHKKLLATFSTEKGGAGFDISPDGRYAAILKDHNILLIPAAVPGEMPAKAIRVTTDGSDSIPYGEAVSQREFGIEKGTFWSPTGKKLAYYRLDQSMIAPYPLVDVRARKAELIPVRYPMAGMPSQHVTVQVYDIETGETTFVNTGGDPEHYLTNLTWSPDGRLLYIEEVNRAQNNCRLNAYNTETGQRIVTLLEERDDKYVEPTHPIVFLPGDNGQFIRQSRQDGWNHLYLHLADGRLVRQLTEGKWEVTEILGFSTDGQTVYYESTEASPLERKGYALNLKSGKSRCLTPEKGVHSVQVSSDGRHLIDVYQSSAVPRISQIRSSDGKHCRSLLVAPNPDEGYRMPEIEVGTIKAADDSTELYYRLVKPLDYSPKNKYPVIVYVYGGPHAQLIEDRWHSGAGGWDIYMAQQGYAVFTLDNRGSANRGKAFEQVIHRHLGEAETADQMRGIDFLSTLPWIDTARIGVSGWSFGGFMTINLMLTHPNVFKVGSAGGPVIDWSLYEVMYGERYMDTPQENPEGYRKANLALRAGDLKGRLMMIHGDIDNVVVWQHSLRMLKACVDAHTHPDYMVYPGHEHNVTGPDRLHLFETITRYFKDHL